MKPVTIEVSPEILTLTGWTEPEAKERMQRALVMDLVRRGEISTGKATELLGISRWDIDAILTEYGIDTVDY